MLFARGVDNPYTLLDNVSNEGAPCERTLTMEPRYFSDALGES